MGGVSTTVGPKITTAIKLSKAERLKIDRGAAAVGLNRSQFMRAACWAVLGSTRAEKRSSA